MTLPYKISLLGIRFRPHEAGLSETDSRLKVAIWRGLYPNSAKGYAGEPLWLGVGRKERIKIYLYTLLALQVRTGVLRVQLVKLNLFL